MGFKKLGKDCPICHGGRSKKGDCRTNDDGLVFCWSHSYAPSGYKLLGLSQIGASFYIPWTWEDEERDRNRDSAEIEAIRKQAATDKEKRKRKERASLPTLTERDRRIRRNPASLKPHQHQDLLRRGLTAREIDQALHHHWLFSRKGGYGIAAVDPVSGLLAGYQVATDNRQPKYKWGMAGETHLKETDANPLFPWRSPQFDPTQPARVLFCEGALKSLIRAVQEWRSDHQVIVIGAAGGVFNDAALKRVLKGLGLPDGTSYTLLPDSGSQDLAKRNIESAYRALAQSIPSIKFADWGQWRNDNAADPDETWGTDSFSGYRLRSPLAWLRHFRHRDRFTPHHVTHESFLSGAMLWEILQPAIDANEGVIFAIKSGLGTNKTGATGELIKVFEDAGIAPDGVICISDLNRLLLQTVQRFRSLGLRAMHLHDDDAKDMIASVEMVIMACFNSLHHWADDDFDGKVVLWDEPIAGVDTLLGGATIPNPDLHREILRKVEAMIKRCKLLILTDGNLTDDNVQFFQSISGGKRVIKIENIAPSRHYKIKLWPDRDEMIQHFLESVVQGKRCSFGSDNAAELRRIYEQLQRLGYQPHQIIIVDAESTEQECPAAFKSNPGQYLQAHPEVMMVLFSPSMNRGFDIDGEMIRDGVEWFDSAYLLSTGILGANALDQHMFRLRSQSVQRHAFLAKVRSAQAIQDIEAFNASFLDHAELYGCRGEALATMAKILAAAAASDPKTVYTNQLGEIQKREGVNLRSEAIALWESKGIDVVPYAGKSLVGGEISRQEREEIKQEIKAAKERENEVRAIAMVEAPPTTDDLEENPDQYPDVTPADIARRDRLDSQLPGFVHSESFTPENVAMITADPTVVQGIELLALVQQPALENRRATNQLLRAIIDHHRDRFTWVGDINTQVVRVQAYRDLGVLNLQGQWLTHNCDAVKALHRKLTPKMRGRLKMKGKSKTDPIKSLKAAIAPLGLTLESKKMKGTRYYRITPALPSALHDQLMRSVQRRHEIELHTAEKLGGRLNQDYKETPHNLSSSEIQTGKELQPILDDDRPITPSCPSAPQSEEWKSEGIFAAAANPARGHTIERVISGFE